MITPRALPALLLLAQLCTARGEEPLPKGALHRIFVEDGVTDVRFSPDGLWLAAANFDSTVRVYESATGKAVRKFEGHEGRATCVAWSPDGKAVASGGENGDICFWSMETGKRTAVFAAVHGRGTNGFGVVTLGYFPDGKRLFSTGYDPVIRIWDLETGKRLQALEGHRDCVAACLTGDGRRLISTSQDGTARVWDTETWKSAGELKIVPQIEAQSPHLGFPSVSRDGSRVIAGGGDGRIRSWDILSRERGGSWAGHTGFVAGVEISPGDTLVASGGMHPRGALGAPDGTWNNDILIRNAESGEILLTLAGGHSMSIGRCRFSPEGEMLATTSWDGSVIVWDLVSLGVHRNALKEESPARLWQMMAEEGGRGILAARALAGRPDEALALLDAELKPAAADAAFGERIAALIAGLDDDDPAVRDSAQASLEQLGPRARTALEKAAKDSPSAEVRVRAREVLVGEAGWSPSGGEERRLAGAVRILEALPDRRGRPLLEKLAGGGADAALTWLAGEALKRMAR